MRLVHAVYEPPGDGPFPTIFAMHGWGSNAMDLLGLAPFVAKGRFLVICPQGPHEVEIGAVNGFGWYQMRPGAAPDNEKVAPAVEQLRLFIDEAWALLKNDAISLLDDPERLDEVADNVMG